VSRLSIRLRLAIAATVAMAALLLAAGVFVHQRLRSDLSQALDQSLRQRSQDLVMVVRGTSAPPALDTHGLVERGESFAQVYDGHGDLIASSPSLHGQPLLGTPELHLALHGAAFFDRSAVPGLDEPARLMASPVPGRGDTLVLLVGATKGNLIETLASLRTGILVFGPLALAVAFAGGYLLAAAALRPVETMRRRAAAITAGTPGQRLPTPHRRDELARLGATLNGMLARLEAALDREHAFVADASHELRTPLALLRTELELALRYPRSAADLRRAIESAAEESQRLTALAEDLLLIAAVEQGRTPMRLETVPTLELLRSSLERFGPELARQGRASRLDCDGAATLTADAQRLERAIHNLIDNAVRHGRGTVQLCARIEGAAVELHVTDDGPGFPPHYLARAFERFSRPDTARGGGGTGLGLAIVQSVAQAHSGTAHAANRTNGGADVWLTLPRFEKRRPAGPAARPSPARLALQSPRDAVRSDGS
jgi:signal transduction histidine kinase